MGIVGEPLIEIMGQSREAPRVHSHREIGAFCVAGAYVSRIGIAPDRGLRAPMQGAGLYRFSASGVWP